ncbi:MAG: DUF924 domain-containing protein [Alphaproteobacteria bacterium]|nr:DUF924 domain-containing protein [Alphaproteobacteria bacterium]MBL6777388.1 DUF924 domain-containing protein [Alphaproteobacteria bacterium]
MTLNAGDESQINAILSFWFEEITPEHWFTKNDDFDQQLKYRFEALVTQALNGQLDRWAANSDGCLSLILLLDQMTRNIYRDTPKAFAGDEIACALSLRAAADKRIETESQEAKRQFFLMPMMHSEDIAIQDASLPLFKEHTSERTYDYAVRHRDIVARFGRFPHRNAILGRPSTDAEITFLKEPNSSF